jgi:alpha-tubulin suppressor-like RCC1 family protein
MKSLSILSLSILLAGCPGGGGGGSKSSAGGDKQPKKEPEPVVQTTVETPKDEPVAKDTMTTKMVVEDTGTDTDEEVVATVTDTGTDTETASDTDTQTDGQLRAVLTTIDYSFGDPLDMQASAEETRLLTITNEGDGQALNVQFSATAPFDVGTGCGSTLAAGASCQLQVILDLGSAGQKEGDLTISYNDGLELKTTTVQLSAKILENRVVKLDTGASVAFALRRDGTLEGWGSDNGHVVDGGGVYFNQDFDFGEPVADVSVGNGAVCVKLASGAIKCFAFTSNAAGTVPFAITGITGSVAKMDLGYGGYKVLCALNESGQAFCAGNKGFCMHGDGDCNTYGAVQTNATAVTQGSLVFKEITVGKTTVCAVATDGKVYCWGTNEGGKIQDSAVDTDTFGTPTEVSGLIPAGKAARKVALTEKTVCALVSDDAVYCRGTNSGGELNLADRTLRSTVSKVMTDVSDISTSNFVTCGLKKDRTVVCFGTDAQGAIAKTRPSDFVMPETSVGFTNARVMTVGAASTCAVDYDDVIRCQGNRTRDFIDVTYSGPGGAAGVSDAPVVIVRN